MASTQIIVVGGGLAGLSAAHTVLENGGRVLLIDKNAFMGGNSTKATSGINGALTKSQIKLNIPDSPELFEQDTVQSAALGDPNAPSYPLAKVLTHESAPAVEWLINHFGLDLSLVSRLGSHSQPRTHRGKEKFPGMTITYALMEKFELIEKQTNKQRARLILKARVTKLLTGAAGEVIGVEYTQNNQNFTEYGPVIIATGGYGADFTENSLLKKFRPDLANFSTTNGEHCTGDGIKMSQAIGADVVDMEWIQVHPTGMVHPNDPNAHVKFLAAEALRGVGGIILDRHGNRFCNELGRRDYVSEMMSKNAGPFRLILNGKASKEIEWHCKHYTGRGLMKHFKSGAEIAKEMSISPVHLEKTFSVYNDIAAKKQDPFGKKFFDNLPYSMSDDNYHIAIVTPVVHYCMGGLKISPNAEILNSQDKPIPNLYATGEVCGGVHGKNRLGGNSLLDCVVFGRVSGNSATRKQFESVLTTMQTLEKEGKLVQGAGRVQQIGGQISGGNNQQNNQTPTPTSDLVREITLEEVAKHTKESDVWVVVGDLVLDVTKFLDDHPGGKDAIMLFAGKDATEQFDMLHQRSVLDKYASDFIIGKLKGASKNRTHQTTTAHTHPSDEIALLKPSNVSSRYSGGTADILPNERKKCTFDVKEMTHLIDGGPEMTKKKYMIRSPITNEDFSDRSEMTREEIFKEHVKSSIKVHTSFKNYRPSRKETTFMHDSIAPGGSSIGNHMALFLGTIYGQGSDEQQAMWANRAMNFQITGNYCQTELGHGSNVRGLETTATYDKANQQFIIDTPTLTARKWWPGALGKFSTHAAVYAQLIINGEEKGPHVFMVQIRDENHKPLPGITIGDLGAKIGDACNDTGFLVMDNIRIPREHMFCRHSKVMPDGTYVHETQNKQVHYYTMMATRCSMVSSAASRLAIACTISIRYSCVRKQGFMDTAGGVSYNSPERQIIDYKIQQYRQFKQLSLAYTIRMSSMWMLEKLATVEGEKYGKITNTGDLKEVAALSAGLKSLCTKIAVDGIEDLRKSCGGNGYLLHSGIAFMGNDYLWQVTAEGDYIILTLLTARFLIKGIQETMNGKQQKRLLEFFNVLLDPKYSIKRGAPVEAHDFHAYTDLAYLGQWFTFRALSKIVTAAMQLKKHITKEQKSFDEAWNLSSIDLLKATWSYCYSLMFQNFVHKIDATTNQPIKQILHKLCAFYACTNMLDDDWGSVLPPSQYALIRDAVHYLMPFIRPDCIGLTDAFDYPDNVLCSTIGKHDGNVYEALVKASHGSRLNRTDPFDGYKEYLQPHLNQEFLKIGNNKIPDKFKDAKL